MFRFLASTALVLSVALFKVQAVPVQMPINVQTGGNIGPEPVPELMDRAEAVRQMAMEEPMLTFTTAPTMDDDDMMTGSPDVTESESPEVTESESPEITESESPTPEE